MIRSSRLHDPSVSGIEAVTDAAGTNIDHGLAQQEALRRLSQNGPNALRSAPLVPAWRRLLSQFQDPLIYLLLVAITISLAGWAVEGRHGWPIDAVVIAIVVLLNGALGYLEQAKARDAVAALARMTQVNSSVIRGAQTLRVPSADLVVGDLLLLDEGDAVGADARLIQATALHVQEASLTGESHAVLKNAATLPAPVAIGDRLNMVFKGTMVVQGQARAVVTATGPQTEMGAIADMLNATVEAPTPLEKEISHIGRVLGMAVIAIAAVVVATILWLSDISSASDVLKVLLLGVALAVAAVPEGLPAILSVVLALGVRRMAGHKAIVKKLSSVETLGSATVICSDKTGTLTRAEMTIVRIATASGTTSVTGVGYEPYGHVESAGTPIVSSALFDEQAMLLNRGCLAGNASLSQGADGQWAIQGDPTEAAFWVAELKLGVSAQRQQRFERIGQLPFTAVRKMMSTIEIDHAHSDQIIVITKGAPDVLLQRCSHQQTGADIVPLEEAQRARILADVDALSDAALRTLSVAYRPLLANENQEATEVLEQGLVFIGTVGMMDPPREEAAVAIREAQQAGIRIIMITGDHPRTAVRIATDLGIVQAGATVLTGLEIETLDKAAFAAATRTTSVYARVSPAHKLCIIDALQADGNVVAMTGDGVNDAPALKSADIGIAMGVTGTEVAKDAAKVILVDDNFATIVQAVREGRTVLDNIRKFLRYLLSSNMGEVLTVFFGIVGAGVIGLTQPGMAVVLPLLATQILWINLITDSWPALAMGIDPPTDDVMKRKPRRPGDRVMDARMWTGIFEIGAVVALVTLLTMDIYLPGGLIEGTGDMATARTAGFTVLVLAHLVNCFNARSESTSAFGHVFSNPWLLAAIALSGILQVAVVHVPVLNIAFGTVPLTASQWLVCAGMASTVLWYSELRKLVGRTWRTLGPSVVSIHR